MVCLHIGKSFHGKLKSLAMQIKLGELSARELRASETNSLSD